MSVLAPTTIQLTTKTFERVRGACSRAWGALQVLAPARRSDDAPRSLCAPPPAAIAVHLGFRLWSYKCS